MTATTGSDTLVAFALRTSDQKWIARNNATVNDDELVFVMVPAGEVKMEVLQMPHRELVKLTRKFGDCPKDFPNPWIVSFGDWVPETVTALTALGR